MRRKEDNVARMYVEERRWKRLIVDKGRMKEDGRGWF